MSVWCTSFALRTQVCAQNNHNAASSRWCDLRTFPLSACFSWLRGWLSIVCPSLFRTRSRLPLLTCILLSHEYMRMRGFCCWSSAWNPWNACEYFLPFWNWCWFYREGAHLRIQMASDPSQHLQETSPTPVRASASSSVVDSRLTQANHLTSASNFRLETSYSDKTGRIIYRTYNLSGPCFFETGRRVTLTCCLELQKLLQKVATEGCYRRLATEG